MAEGAEIVKPSLLEFFFRFVGKRGEGCEGLSARAERERGVGCRIDAVDLEQARMEDRFERRFFGIDGDGVAVRRSHDESAVERSHEQGAVFCGRRGDIRRDSRESHADFVERGAQIFCQSACGVEIGFDESEFWREAPRLIPDGRIDGHSFVIAALEGLKSFSIDADCRESVSVRDDKGAFGTFYGSA